MSAIAAVMIAAVSLLQYCEARRDRLEASEALDRATDAERAAQEATALLDLNHLIWRAGNDDLVALEEVSAMASSRAPDGEIARGALSRLLHPPYDSLVTTATGVDWAGHGLDPASYSIEQLRNAYPNMTHAEGTAVVSGVWRQDRFSVAEKLGFLAFVLETGTSIAAVSEAVGLMNLEAKIDDARTPAGVEDAPLRREEFLHWWLVHRGRYDQ